MCYSKYYLMEANKEKSTKKVIWFDTRGITHSDYFKYISTYPIYNSWGEITRTNTVLDWHSFELFPSRDIYSHLSYAVWEIQQIFLNLIDQGWNQLGFKANIYKLLKNLNKFFKISGKIHSIEIYFHLILFYKISTWFRSMIFPQVWCSFI